MPIREPASSFSALAGEPTAVGLAADWHGNLAWALRVVDAAHQLGVRVLLHLGDLGIGWLPDQPNFEYLGDPRTVRFFEQLDQRLTEYGMLLLGLDGNHDNHEAIAARPVDSATGTRPLTARIHHLPRGFRWSWPDADGRDYTWMALGGAVSMDRDRLLRGESWWPGEVLSYAEARKAAGGGPVDVMLTHDIPAGVTVPRLTGRWPADVTKAAWEHRQLIRSVVDQVRPVALFHGHMHRRYDAQLALEAIDGDQGRVVEVHGLDCDEHGLAANLVLVAPAGYLLCPACRHRLDAHDDGEGCLAGWDGDAAGCPCRVGVAPPRTEPGTLDLIAAVVAAGGGTGEFRRRAGGHDGRRRRNR